MTKTYQLTIDNQPFAYVFYEDSVVSYTPVTEGRGLQMFFKTMLSHQHQIRTKVDYASVGFQSIRLLYSIALIHGSDNILDYLKRFRDEIGIGLKVKNGLFEKYYNDTHRVNEIEAQRKLQEMIR